MTATGVQDPPTTSSVPALASVTAVVVTAGRTAYLSRTLLGLAAQTRRPVRVLLVDVGGPDGAAALLDEAFAPVGGVVTAHAQVHARSFGQAVDEGLRKLADVAGVGPTAWLWLLHDDSAPAPDALAALVRAVEQAPSVAVAGAKQRTWTDPERLLEVGLSTTRSGRRVSGVEPGELDQGQHDGATDVLGVGLAGALVRSDVWADLGGTDPALGPFGDGLDVSRRARLAGHRVIVVPAAVVRHVQAGYLGLRGSGAELVDADGDGEPDAADPRRSYAARRRSLVHSRLTAAPAWALPFVLLAAALAAPVRALGQLVVSAPGLAMAELRGGWGALVRPLDVGRGRAAARRAARVPRRTLWPLQTGWREVWAAARDRRLARTQTRRAPSELEAGELAALAVRRRVTFAVLSVALVVASAVALGPLLVRLSAGGRLVGGTLAYTTTTWTQLWAAATSGWLSGGLGAPGPADPLLRVLALPAALTGGNLEVVVAVLLLGGVLLAGWGAWVAAGAATRSTGVRAWAALVWAFAPPLLLAIDTGRVGAVLAHLALPWLALALARALGVQRVDRVLSGLATARRADEDDLAAEEPRPAALLDGPIAPPAAVPGFGPGEPTRSVAALGGAGLAAALVAAGAPVLLVPLLVVCALLAVSVRGGWRVVLVPLPALVLLGPLLVEAASRGVAGLRLLVAEPGGPSAVGAAGAVDRALGLPTVAAALVPSWVPSWGAAVWPVLPGALVLLVAVLALVRGGSAGRGVRLGWLVAVVGWAAATGVAALPAVRDPGAVGPAWTGATLSFALAGLLGAGLVGVDRVTERLSRYAFGWRQQVSAALVAVAVVVVAVGAVSWTWQSRTGDGIALQADDGRVVPAVGQQAFAAPAGSRVLLLTAGAGGGPVRWQLVRADGVQQVDEASAVWTRDLTGPLAAASPSAPDAGSTEASTLVAALATGAGVDESAPLAALGVAHVQVPALPGGESDTGAAAQARAELVGRLDATAGLERVTSGSDGTLWRVASLSTASSPAVTSWARLVPAGADPVAAGTAATAVAGDGRRVVATLAAAAQDRTLVLAERSGSGWQASVAGRPLRSTTVGWRQGFVVPAGVAGALRVRYVDPTRTFWLAAQGITGLVVVLLAVPLHRRRGARR